MARCDRGPAVIGVDRCRKLGTRVEGGPVPKAPQCSGLGDGLRVDGYNARTPRPVVTIRVREGERRGFSTRLMDGVADERDDRVLPGGWRNRNGQGWTCERGNESSRPWLPRA